MATESIGTLIPTAIPGYTDSADIQAALRAYHYGSYSYDPANTSPGSLVTPSIAKTIYDIQADITSLENRPSSGGEVDATQPAPEDFTPPEIPDGFIWVDSDGTVGGQPTSATSVFTNSAPTTSLTTGVIWVDKDPTSITANPFIPTAMINAKGDLIVGSADDAAVRLAAPTTNGYMLYSNSATTSGLEWSTAPAGYSAPVLGSTTITSGATVTTVAGLTLTGSTLTTPTLTLSATTSTTNAQIAWVQATDKIVVGDGTNAIEFASSTLITNAQTGSYTLVAADKDKLVEMNVASANNLTVPLNSSVPYPVGTQINILQTNSGQTTVAPTGGVTINATPGLKLRAQWSSATLIKRATDTWVLVGDLSA
jgi:hypothetical protein